jgi:C-terminal processing protease CtpA/Prc
LGMMLYKYLTKKTLCSYSYDIKDSQEVKDFRKYYEWIENGTMLSNRDHNLEFPYNSRLDEDKLSTLQQFTGQVYVLIDNEVASSREWIASEMYANDLGIFVGESTGGGGTVPGDTIQLILPNTKLSLFISYKLFVSPVKPDATGVMPHIWKRQSLSDYWAAKDTVLEFVKEKCTIS